SSACRGAPTTASARFVPAPLVPKSPSVRWQGGHHSRRALLSALQATMEPSGVFVVALLGAVVVPAPLLAKQVGVADLSGGHGLRRVRGRAPRPAARVL